MDFSQALGQIKAGVRLRRGGWKTWVAIVPSNFWAIGIALPFAAGVVDLGTATASPAQMSAAAAAAAPTLAAWLVIQNADGTLEPWTPAQCDLLAEDWEVAT